MARDPTGRYFAGTDRDRAAFEAGIKLGSILHQYVGVPLTRKNATSLERKVYPVPEEIDNEIARLKLATMDVDIDQLTEEQAKYLASWDEGT